MTETPKPRDPSAPQPVPYDGIPRTEAGPVPPPPPPGDPIPVDPVVEARKAMGTAVGWTKVVTAYLEAVVPIDHYEVEDVTGHRHTFRTALTARAQLATSLRVERFVDAYATPELAAEVLGQADAGGWRAGLRHFLQTATQNEQAQKDLQEIFAGCHPRLLHHARQQATQVWEDEDHDLTWLWKGEGLTEAPTHVLDLFESDALLEALVPFFARFVRRTGRAISKLMGTEAAPGGTSPPSSPPNPSPP